ncbi:AMP-binding protein [Kocuria marina]|uniref:Fatty-acyl-CoA synthase n=1 Tax=Kocuria marina subsp. indica TaxID=1049583 RepID=A0A1X7E4U2_9MICC|nr:AMP-binding protein [Kocuria indica]OXS79873.1 acyl-CoA synthetase [Kocuria indica]RLP56790.1 acyl-CoA synthetase [Kocuria indica]SMF27058.1 fatty-acyl-CoA synthase [Kocuria indica]
MFANTEPLTPLRFLERSAEVFPDRPAIVHGSRVWSYEQFERDVRRFATALLPLLSGSDGSAGAASRGSAGSDDAAGSPESAGSRESAGSAVTGGSPGTVESGDTAGSERSAGASGEGNESFQGAELLECSWPTVAVIAPNLPATLMAHYAVPAAGAVLVPLNPRLSARELSYILEHCEARVVLADTSVLETVAQALGDGSDVTLVQIDDPQAGVHPVRDGAGSGVSTFEEFIDVEPAQPAGPGASGGNDGGVGYGVADENAPITLNYTSGTTGRPKGVLYSHRGAYLNSLGEVFHNGFTGATRYLWTLPMFHCNGWCTTWAVTAAGGTHVCLRAVRADEIWRAFDEQGITHLCGAPAVCSIIVDASEAHPLEHTIRITTAGAPPAPSIIERLESAGFDIVHVYGLTEVFGPITICEPQEQWRELSPRERAQQMSRQGVAMIQAESARVVDDSLEDVPADGTTVGEVVLRGNNVMIGYYKDVPATRKAFEGGWFHTGDLGVMHPNNYIQLRDRAKDIIISGGENISSIEVEQALYSHPDVADVAVVGVAHEKWGERPVAHVVRVNGSTVTEEELRDHVRNQLSGFKVPDSVVFSDELPRTATGKVRKNLLRD